MLRVWHGLVYLGDGAVLMPCAALLFVWLVATPASRRTGWWWLVAVLLVCGGVALSKLIYMVSGWHPTGWNFIGLSGHAALSFLFFPVAAALLTGGHGAWPRVVLVALGACLALAISFASWASGDHSLVEAVLGATWGALVASIFLAATWRQVLETPLLRAWGAAGMLLLLLVTYRQEFPSTRVLGWVALQWSERTTIYTRSDLGAHAPSSHTMKNGRRVDTSTARMRKPPPPENP